ncbi:hypothetical protein LCGC14_2004790 [marine sediment metagenome]|uniref:Uncharacterized protein n=1 Tax=marine sediment metagenome TaxID=412755 RepID=A0A0F9F272_9ZZZZ
MYECNTGIECKECEKFGGCDSHLEKKCLCGKKILIKEAACPECLVDLDATMDILDRKEN